MANLNTVGLSDTIKAMYETRLLTRAVPRFVYGRAATVARLNKYGSYELRKFGSVSAVSTPLTEGNTPGEGSAPAITKVTFTPAWYGSWLSYTDQLDMQNFDPVISETSGILGEQAGLSFDTLLRTLLTGGATKDYTGIATSRATLAVTTDKANFGDFVGALATLEQANAMPSMGGGYCVVTGPYVWAQWMQDPTFVALFTREGGEAIRMGKMGSILNAEIYVTSNVASYADAGAAGADVYSALFIGAESYGIAGMGNTVPNVQADSGGELFGTNNTSKGVKPVEIIVKGLGETGLDPLNQRGTIGWKATYDGQILNSAWLLDQETVTMFG